MSGVDGISLVFQSADAKRALVKLGFVVLVAWAAKYGFKILGRLNERWNRL